jgi:hypothetical protein
VNLFQSVPTGKGARLAAAELQSTADANGRAFILKARKSFESFLGSRYSQAWNEVGFTNNSLAVPGTLAKRVELLNHVASYLTEHPEREVDAMGITAAAATGFHTALDDAISGMNAGWGAQLAAREGRDTPAEALRDLLRGLVGELTTLIGPRDPRWLDFGFNIPDDETKPDVPEGLTVVNGAPGHLTVGWAGTPRAERYRVFRQIVGVDPQPVLVRTVADMDANLNTFTTGQHVRVQVTAVNGAGESLPCDPIEHVVP